MRILTIVLAAALVAPAAALAQAKPFTPPQMRIVSDGSLNHEEARKKFNEAYWTCIRSPADTKNDAAFLSCLNRHLPKSIQVEK